MEMKNLRKQLTIIKLWQRIRLYKPYLINSIKFRMSLNRAGLEHCLSKPLRGKAKDFLQSQAPILEHRKLFNYIKDITCSHTIHYYKCILTWLQLLLISQLLYKFIGNTKTIIWFNNLIYNKNNLQMRILMTNLETLILYHPKYMVLINP